VGRGGRRAGGQEGGGPTGRAARAEVARERPGAAGARGARGPCRRRGPPRPPSRLSADPGSPSAADATGPGCPAAHLDDPGGQGLVQGRGGNLLEPRAVDDDQRRGERRRVRLELGGQHGVLAGGRGRQRGRASGGGGGGGGGGAAPGGGVGQRAGRSSAPAGAGAPRTGGRAGAAAGGGPAATRRGRAARRPAAAVHAARGAGAWLWPRARRRAWRARRRLAPRTWRRPRLTLTSVRSHGVTTPVKHAGASGDAVARTTARRVARRAQAGAPAGRRRPGRPQLCMAGGAGANGVGGRGAAVEQGSLARSPSRAPATVEAVAREAGLGARIGHRRAGAPDQAAGPGDARARPLARRPGASPGGGGAAGGGAHEPAVPGHAPNAKRGALTEPCAGWPWLRARCAHPDHCPDQVGPSPPPTNPPHTPPGPPTFVVRLGFTQTPGSRCREGGVLVCGRGDWRCVCWAGGARAAGRVAAGAQGGRGRRACGRTRGRRRNAPGSRGAHHGGGGRAWQLL
jgi:hypothetical protein